MSIAQKPDIIDWKLNHTMSFVAFQHLLELLAAQGIHIIERHKSNTICDNCKIALMTDMFYGFSFRDIKYHYSLCHNCWQVGLLIPIYEDDCNETS